MKAFSLHGWRIGTGYAVRPELRRDSQIYPSTLLTSSLNMSGLRCRTFGKPLKIQFEGSIDQRNWASLSVSQCIIMIIRLENTSSAVPMISDDSPTIQSDRQKGPKGLIQCPQRFLEPFSRPPKLTNWSISPWLPFVEHGDAPRWRPNLPGIILMSATMQHETFQKWPRLKLGGKRRRSHTIYSLHLFTSLYILQRKQTCKMSERC